MPICSYGHSLIAGAIFIAAGFFETFFSFLKGKISQAERSYTITIGKAGQFEDSAAY